MIYLILIFSETRKMIRNYKLVAIRPDKTIGTNKYISVNARVNRRGNLE
jgi:hypothetical protein